jgi:molybdate transport system substrate-binding protein
VKRRALWILLGLLAVALVGLPVFEGWMRSKSGSARAEPRTEQVRWFAAASLSRVAEQFSRYHPTEQVPGVQIGQQLSAGSSSQLAQQLIASDETGVFLSADRAWVDALVEAKRVDGEPVLLARNRLVWIAPRDFGFRTYVNDADFFRQLNNPAVTVALADDAVPAGRYAKAWLESRGQWNDSIRMARMGDVTSVLGIVSSGAALLGCVYASDVTEDARVDVVYAVAGRRGVRGGSGSDARHRSLGRGALRFGRSPTRGPGLLRVSGRPGPVRTGRLRARPSGRR